MSPPDTHRRQFLKNIAALSGLAGGAMFGSERDKRSQKICTHGQNCAPTPLKQGFPLRLVVSGLQGIDHVKWPRRIYLVDRPHMRNRESTKYPSPRPGSRIALV
jgi:DMSO/TMAO reductase YedYZ molybdopterin-dependent catalytic subunit